MQNKIDKTFKWKDRFEDFHYPCEMNTNHIFYTVLMIWNHSQPEELKIKPYEKYSFPDFYSNEYMILAFKNLFVELLNRNDLTKWMKFIVSVMI